MTVSLPERGQLLGVDFLLLPLANENIKINTFLMKRPTFVEVGTPVTESAPSISLTCPATRAETSCYESTKMFLNALNLCDHVTCIFMRSVLIDRQGWGHLMQLLHGCLLPV